MNPRNQPITLLSGLPESGVSLLHARLAEAGVQFVAPCGRLEWGRYKHAPGQCTVMPWMDLHSLPDIHRFRIVLVRRNLGEVVLARLARLAKRNVDPLPSAERLYHRYQRHFRSLTIELHHSRNIEVLHISHADLMKNTDAVVQLVREFIDASRPEILVTTTQQ
jgi:hypothetical protein